MYEQYFNLKSRPFSSMPNVEQYVPATAIQKSFSQARMCIDRSAGPVVVIGDPGTGKSLLMALLNEQYRGQYRIANLVCSRLDGRQELLQNILFELQLPYRGLSEGELRLSLTEYLRSDSCSPNGLLFLVDEAHNLSVGLLDEIRLISNVIRNGQPRAKCVLAGTIRLEESINDPRLQSFSQQIAARCYLTNLLQSETSEYVTIHIDRSGGDGKQIFTPSSLQAIHELTDGSPRFINQLCDHTLILTMADGRNCVQEETVREAWGELQNLPGAFCAPQSFTGSSISCGSNRDESVKSDWTVIEFGSLDDDDSSADHQSQADLDVAQPCPLQTLRPQIEITGEYFEPEAGGENSAEVQEKWIAATTQLASNPFAEVFDHVETIQDRFETMVADCNRAAIKTSSVDLSCLTGVQQVVSCDTARSIAGIETTTDESQDIWSSPDEYESVGFASSQIVPLVRGDSDSVCNPFGGEISAWTGFMSSDGQQELTDRPQQIDGVPNENFVSIQPGYMAADQTDNPVYSGRPATFKFQSPFDNRPSTPVTGSDQSEPCKSTQPDELEFLRAKIEEQNRFSAHAFDRIVVETNSQAKNTGWKITPVQTASTTTQVKASVQQASGDDRDILICEQTHWSDEQTKAKSDSTEMAFAQTPVSTGRAERIDYKQLFDQLRNLPENS